MIEKQPDVSFADFVAWEQDQAERHELIGGRVVRFLAGSVDHETITVNVISKFHASVEPPCRVFPSTAIVQTLSRTGEDGYRPDVTVSCSTANVGSRLYVEMPGVIVEVVSPSNFGREWNAKLFEYWNTPNIEQFVLIESLERVVTSYVRDADGTWQKLLLVTAGALHFAPVGVSMAFDKIYQNTSLE
jgi:Uma2 family endonuclease